MILISVPIKYEFVICGFGSSLVHDCQLIAGIAVIVLSNKSESFLVILQFSDSEAFAFVILRITPI